MAAALGAEGLLGRQLLGHTRPALKALLGRGGSLLPPRYRPRFKTGVLPQPFRQVWGSGGRCWARLSSLGSLVVSVPVAARKANVAQVEVEAIVQLSQNA